MTDPDRRDTNHIALALERHFQQPVPLTLGRLRDILTDLTALGPDGRRGVLQVGQVLDRHGLTDLPLAAVTAMLDAVTGLRTDDDVAARFTPREMEDLLARVQ